MRLRAISTVRAGAFCMVIVIGGPLTFTNPELAIKIDPTAISPTGGATARGCSGGTMSGWGTRPGMVRSRLKVCCEAWGAAAKVRIRLLPSALTRGRPRGKPGTGATWMSYWLPTPERLIDWRPASGSESVWDPRRRPVGVAT